MRFYLFLLVILFAACTTKTEIAQWRGENRNGIFNETGLLKTWPENGPEMLWANENIGVGYGSVSVTSDRIYFNSVIDSISYLIALDLNGDFVWKTPNGDGYVGEGYSSSFPGSRSTPTVIGDLVYSQSGLGRIACYDVKTGTENWAVDMQKDFNGIIDYFGYGESLLIDDNKLFGFPGGVDTNLIALDRYTGETLWVSKALSDTVSHCSPMIIELPNRKILVTFSIRNLMGIDAETGELLWSHKQDILKYNEQSNTPIFKNGYLYYVAGDGNGAVKLEISEDGNSIKEIWSNYFGRNSMNGFLVLNDKLYSTYKKNKLKAFDTNNGEVVDSIRIRDGAVIAADDMIYCYSDNGEVSLIDYNKEEMELLGQFKVDKGTLHHFARPVIKNGVLYIRHGEALIAYNIKVE